MFWIEGGLAFEHGASDGEQTVGNTAQGAAMAMTALAQFGVAGAAAGVVLDGDAGPMVDGGAQPQMTGLAHENHAALAAAPRQRGNTGQSAQRMVISFAQRLRSLALALLLQVFGHARPLAQLDHERVFDPSWRKQCRSVRKASAST